MVRNTENIGFIQIFLRGIFPTSKSVTNIGNFEEAYLMTKNIGNHEHLPIEKCGTERRRIRSVMSTSFTGTKKITLTFLEEHEEEGGSRRKQEEAGGSRVGHQQGEM